MSAGSKIIEGLKDAAAGNFARVTIDGQTWERVDEIERLRAALKECADDLAAYIEHHYACTLDYPSQRAKYEAAMAIVIEARKLEVRKLLASEQAESLRESPTNPDRDVARQDEHCPDHPTGRMVGPDGKRICTTCGR